MNIDKMKTEYGHVTVDGKEYVLTETAYVDGPVDNYHYEAHAILPDEGADEDGFYPVYLITWTPTDSFIAYAEECSRNGDWCDEGDACDWDNPEDIRLLFGLGYDLEHNRIV